jgi:hypothetical protein
MWPFRKRAVQDGSGPDIELAKKASTKLTELEMRAIVEVGSNPALWPGLLCYRALHEADYARDLGNLIH